MHLAEYSRMELTAGFADNAGRQGVRSRIEERLRRIVFILFVMSAEMA